MVFSHSLETRRKYLVLYTKGFSIHDIHARLEEEEIFVSKKTLYCILKKYRIVRKHHTYMYRPTDLQRADHKTVLAVDWLDG